MKYFMRCNMSHNLFVNMDQTAIYFESNPVATVNSRGEKTISIRAGAGVKECWMDERTTALWLEKIWKPHASGKSHSLLLLDKFKCHTQAKFISTLRAMNTRLVIVPGGCTSVLQPCDV
eukprot:IDg22020t1